MEMRGEVGEMELEPWGRPCGLNQEELQRALPEESIMTCKTTEAHLVLEGPLDTTSWAPHPSQ